MATAVQSETLTPDRSLAATATSHPRIDGGEHRAHARRIAYFMLFRVAILALFTIVAGAVFYTQEAEFDPLFTWFVWGTLVVGYTLTILFAWRLPSARDLETFAWLQTAFDVVLAAVVVQMSGGVDSGFAFLYLIAILGAATMGDRRQIWATAGACALIYAVLSTLEFTRFITPLTSSGDSLPLPAVEHWGTVARTLAGLLGVTVLSAYLNAQVVFSARQIGSLRALNENIVRSLTSGLMTVDERGRVLYFNPAGREILGLDDSTIGRPVERLLRGLGSALKSREPASRLELDLTDGDGRPIHIGLSTAPLVDEDGEFQGHVINFQDLTRLHELSEQVRRNERLAAIGSLAASVAHEIRNPLAAISGSAELLGSSSLDQEDERLLAIISRESGRLGKLISDLLAFTRPKPPELMHIDLVKAVAEAAEAFRTDPSNAEIEVHFSAESGAHTEADPSQLTQVLWNLMRNAADAMDKKGRITLAVTRQHERGIIEVRDTGPGIPDEALERVFDPFFTTKEHGTGFGLAVVHRIIAEHRGEISVESTEGKGAKFTISLPLAENGDSP